MTYFVQIDRASASPMQTDVPFLAAYAMAASRAPHSYFDQHVIRMDDGQCWVADEGSYETLMHDLADRIVCSVPAGRSDEV